MQNSVPKERNRPGIVRKTLDPREWRWKLLERGHEKPRKIYKTPVEAEKRVIDAEFSLVSRMYGFGSILELEEEVRENRKLEKGKENYPKLVEQNEILKNEALFWMDREYLGREVFTRMQKTPPLLVTFVSFPTPYFESLVGAYHLGTNCIHTDEEMLTSFEEIQPRILQISHELHHYAAWLGGGMGIRWRDSEGKPHFRKRVKHWFGKNVKNESLHESFTITLTNQVAYERRGFWEAAGEDELILGLMLQGIAGKDITKKAYFSGDYSEVFSLVERKLGEGTFSEMLEYLDEPYGVWNAIKLVIGKINEHRAHVEKYWEEGVGKVFLGNADNERFIPERYRKDSG